MIKSNSYGVIWQSAMRPLTNGLQIVNLRVTIVFTLSSAIISQVQIYTGTVNKYTRDLQFPSAVILLVPIGKKKWEMEKFSPKRDSSVCVFVCVFCLFVLICLADTFNFPPEAPLGPT